MASETRSMIGTGAAGDEQEQNPTETPVANDAHRELTPDQFQRWAKLVADGQESFPQGLIPEQEKQLFDAIRCLRRRRLIRFIAGQVALDIHCKTAQEHGGSNAKE